MSGCGPKVVYANASTPGGGTTPEAWTEVATYTDLQNAIADGAQILVTSSITLDSDERIDLVAGTVTIGRKAGVIISGGDTLAPFRATGSIAARLILVDPHPATAANGSSTAFLSSHASVGALFEVASGSTLLVESKRLTLNLASGGSFAADGQRLTLDIAQLVAKCPDANAIFASEFGGIGHITTLGGGSSASLDLRTDIGGGVIASEVRVAGSGAGITVAPNTGRERVTCGPLSGTYAKNAGVLMHVFQATLIEAPGCQVYAYGDGPQVIGGYTSDLKLGGLSAGGKAASFVGLDATRMTELGTTYRANFQGCRWAPNGADTITSYGEGSTWVGGEFYAGGGSITFATSAQWAISGAVGGLAITLASGARMRIRDSELAGVTNNDPLSIITGSRGDALSLETTRATRRFEEATLDTEVLPYIRAYWEGRVMPCPPQSPTGPDGVLRSDAGAVASNGTAIDLDAASDRCVATVPWYIGAGPFSFSFMFNPDSNSGGEENLFSFMPGYALAVNYISGNNLRLYYNGALALDTSGANITGAGGEYRITVTRRLNGSTMTVYIYVNGTLRASLADATDVGAITHVLLGTAGSNAVPGQYRRILCVDQGMADATEDLLASNYLKGYGLAA
jgi:hypothetical protein